MRIRNWITACQQPHKGLNRYLPHFLVLVTYLLSSARLFLLISRYSVNILAWDQWDIDEATLFQHHSLWEMFCWQNGPHRQGLGALFQKLIDPRIHWNSRYEAFAIGGIIFVAAVLALLLKIRLYGAIGYSDVLIPLLFLTPLQYETLTAAPNPAHGPLPLLLTVLYCRCWLIHSCRWKYICVLLTNFSLIYTGFGIFIGFITPGLLALDYYANTRHLASRYRWWSFAALSISTVSLASFFVRYKFHAAADCFSSVPKNPEDYLRFVAIMFAHVAGLRIPNPAIATFVGSIVLLWLLAAASLAVRRLLAQGSDTWHSDAAIAALLAFSAAFCLTTAYGRLCLGLQYAASSRYTEYVVLGFFGLYLSSLSASSRNLRNFLILVFLVLSLLSSHRLNRIDAGALRGISDGKRAWRECYLARHDIQECDTLTHFQIYPEPREIHMQEKLDFLESNHLNLYDKAPPDADSGP